MKVVGERVGAGVPVSGRDSAVGVGVVGWRAVGALAVGLAGWDLWIWGWRLLLLRWLLLTCWVSTAGEGVDDAGVARVSVVGVAYWDCLPALRQSPLEPANAMDWVCDFHLFVVVVTVVTTSPVSSSSTSPVFLSTARFRPSSLLLSICCISRSREFSLLAYAESGCVVPLVSTGFFLTAEQVAQTVLLGRHGEGRRWWESMLYSTYSTYRAVHSGSPADDERIAEKRRRYSKFWARFPSSACHLLIQLPIRKLS
ncbi:hypothetical protein KC343_g2 [Hortaea werneckii]|nr:hypothetical protein KC317_g2 [Hortaea werneckii]KAI7628714.1 hypothetical protein KC346_g2 [Hortaea werneckii]KAI7638492.1 hypothetical protein KC343_g2 [Hortaea werneckii]